MAFAGQAWVGLVCSKNIGVATLGSVEKSRSIKLWFEIDFSKTIINESEQHFCTIEIQ